MKTEFSPEFIKLVKFANQESETFYSEKNNKKEPNPYYIGFGNPNANLLILGKEKGFDQSESRQLECESINNPKEWGDYVENEISFYRDNYYKESGYYRNAYFPYEAKKNGGHTWSKYNKLTKLFFDLPDSSENNVFLKHAFISEINHNPSKYSKTRTFNSPERIDFLKNDFYKSFKSIVLACGTYLTEDQIEKIFDVKFFKDLSKPNEKLIIFKNGKDRTLILTRQLSMNVKNDLIEKIAEHLNEK